MDTKEMAVSAEHQEVCHAPMDTSSELGIKPEHDIEDEQWRATEKRLVRKLDMTLLPMVWLLYMFNYLDRNNLAQANLSTFSKDLHLKGNQFNVAISILNVGYMLMQLPRYVSDLLSGNFS